MKNDLRSLAPGAAVPAARELIQQCPLFRRELAAPLVGALAKLGRMSEAEDEARGALEMRFIGSHKEELNQVLGGVGCSLVPLEQAPSRAKLQAFEKATSGSVDAKALEGLRSEPGWLGAAANAWLAAANPDVEARRGARLALEALAGERGSLERLAIPESHTSTKSSWELTPLDHAALLTAGAHLVRITDDQFRPKLALSASAFAASPEGAWVATWKGEQGSLFHSASGVEALQFHCPFEITAVTLERGARELFVTHVRKTITRMPLDGSALPEIVSTAPDVPHPVLPAPAQPLPAQPEPPAILARGDALVVATAAGFLLIDSNQKAIFHALAGANKADLAKHADLALLNNFYKAWLLRIEHPEPPLMTFPASDMRSWELSPRGHFIAMRKPVGPWNGSVNVVTVPGGHAVARNLENYGVVFFDDAERLHYFDEAANLLRYDPKSSRLAVVLTPNVGSYLGVLSSSHNHFLSWQMQDFQPEISIDLSSGKMTGWRAFDAEGHGTTSGLRLMDLSSDGSLALFDLEGAFSLQNASQQLHVVEASRTLFMPGTNGLALVSHTGGVELRSLEGELQLQVLADGTSYVVRGKEFSSSGNIDLQSLRCRVGRHFLPSQLCWSKL